jgi:hypothetical protein
MGGFSYSLPHQPTLTAVTEWLRDHPGSPECEVIDACGGGKVLGADRVRIALSELRRRCQARREDGLWWFTG